VIAVDVGINAISDPQSARVRLVGDIDTADVARRAEALTPVPGGVGPITDVWLLRNTVAAARLAQGIEASFPWTEGLRPHNLG
jgi:methylenetetrahydrofolate dehydrogenase (NADP+)/methenyltetrahydrofolate cyclohydrolase